MGQDLTEEDWNALTKIKQFIFIEHNDVAPPLIWSVVGQTKFLGIEMVDGNKVFKVLVEKIDKNNEGEDISRTELVMRYMFYGGRIKSLETYQEEKRLKSRKRKREVYFK